MSFNSAIIPTIGRDAAFVATVVFTTTNPFASCKGPSFCATAEPDLHQVAFTAKFDDRIASSSSTTGASRISARYYSRDLG